MKESKCALKWTRFLCHDFDNNQIRFYLFALAYNVGNFFRCLVLPEKIRDWSLRAV